MGWILRFFCSSLSCSLWLKCYTFKQTFKQTSDEIFWAENPVILTLARRVHNFYSKPFSWLRLPGFLPKMAQSDVTFERNGTWIHNPQELGQRAIPNTSEVLSGKDTSRRPSLTCLTTSRQHVSEPRPAHRQTGMARQMVGRRFRQYQTSAGSIGPTKSEVGENFRACVVDGLDGLGGSG